MRDEGYVGAVRCENRGVSVCVCLCVCVCVCVVKCVSKTQGPSYSPPWQISPSWGPANFPRDPSPARRQTLPYCRPQPGVRGRSWPHPPATSPPPALPAARPTPGPERSSPPTTPLRGMWWAWSRKWAWPRRWAWQADGI